MREGSRQARTEREIAMELKTLIGEPWADYGLIDCGNGRKLERYAFERAGE